MTARLHPVPQVYGNGDMRPISFLESTPYGYDDESRYRIAYTKAFRQCLQSGYNESDAIAFARGYASAHVEYGYANVVKMDPLPRTAHTVPQSGRRSFPA